MIRDYIVLRRQVAEPVVEAFDARAPRVSRRARGNRSAGLEQHVLSIEALSEKNEAELVRDPAVQYSAPRFKTRLIAPVARKKAAGAQSAWGIAAIRAVESTADGAGVVVAVLDTGIDADHPAFADVHLVQKDFSGDGDGDRDGHGTHCAGTIFGRDVGPKRIGVARGVDRALIGKVLDDQGEGDTFMLCDAIHWAAREGAQVISMSLGFDFPGEVRELVEEHDVPPDIAASMTLDGYRANLRLFDAVLSLIRASADLGRGCVVVAATGNESRRDENEDWVVNASLPAAAEGVVSVGAAERTGGKLAIADFSNAKPSLVAPGVAILSAKAGGGLISFDGTSMACPHVAGAAALWWHALRGTGNAAASNVAAHLLSRADTTVFTSATPASLRGNGLVRCP